LNHNPLPLRQINNRTDSYQKIYTLPSGNFLPNSLLLTSNGGSKGSRDGTTSNERKTENDGGIVGSNTAPEGTQAATAVLQVFFE